MKILSLATVALIILLSGCRDRSDSASTDGRLLLTVSIEPQRQLLEAIGGDRVSVSALLANGEDPETFDPSMTTLIHLDRSAGWLQVGNTPFESELERKLKSGIKCIDTSAGIQLIVGTHHHHHDHGDCDHDHDHDHGDADPHTWSSVKNMKIMAANMRDALIELDPEGTPIYIRRCDSIVSRLDSLDMVYAQLLEPARGSTFMMWHPSLSYFARDYGLNQISVTADHREISLRSLQATIDDAIDNGVEVFFEQSSYDPRLSATVKRHIGAECVSFNPLDYNWQSELDRVVAAIAAHSAGRVNDAVDHK